MSKFKISSLFACFALIYIRDGVSSARVSSDVTDHEPINLDIIQSPSIRDNKVQVGDKFSLTCNANMLGEVWWTRHGTRITQPGHSPASSTYEVQQASFEHSGNYTCVATSEEKSARKTITLTVLEPADMPDEEELRVRSGSPASLRCQLRGHRLSEIKWEKVGEPNKTESLKHMTIVTPQSEDHSITTLNFGRVAHEDNGTYVCSAENHNGTISYKRILLVTDTPEIRIVAVKAVGRGRAYLNWTVNDHNEKITSYVVQHQKADQKWESESVVVNVENSSFITSSLERGVAYRFRIIANNSIGSGMDTYSEWVTLPVKEPKFVPTIKVAKRTNTTITINISPPPVDLKRYDFYYKIGVTDNVNLTLTSRSNVNATAVIIENLLPKTQYQFKASACVYYTKECDNWSAWITGTSMASISSGLHPAGVHLTVVNTALIYFAVKHFLTCG